MKELVPAHAFTARTKVLLQCSSKDTYLIHWWVASVMQQQQVMMAADLVNKRLWIGNGSLMLL